LNGINALLFSSNELSLQNKMIEEEWLAVYLLPKLAVALLPMLAVALLPKLAVALSPKLTVAYRC
jgi:hypothetical protein